MAALPPAPLGSSLPAGLVFFNSHQTATFPSIRELCLKMLSAGPNQSAQQRFGLQQSLAVFRDLIALCI